MVKMMIGDRVMCIYLGFRVIDRLGLEVRVGVGVRVIKLALGTCRLAGASNWK